MGGGLALVAIGLLVALLVNTTLGIIVLVLGIAAIAMSFSGAGPWGARRHTTVIERERRPVTRERETIRETEL